MLRGCLQCTVIVQLAGTHRWPSRSQCITGEVVLRPLLTYAGTVVSALKLACLLPISQSTVCQHEATPGAKCESQRGAFNGMAGEAEKEDKKADQHQLQVQRYAGIHADSSS